jgi:nucleoside-diphosphate-sugar epimerase
MKILVTGGCGYIGTNLIPYLLKKNHKIISVDTKWFGDYLPKHKNLKNLKLDIAEIGKINLKGVDCVIHLASVSNDPMAEIDKNLSWETSALNSMKLMEHLVKNKVKRIIYASSGSVYGINDKKRITEDTELNPISLYNKVKMVTERILQSYSKSIELFIVRPATVCGFSKRMRLDVSVNALTFSALEKKKITVFGGNQVRPNIHMDDMVKLYDFLIKVNKKFTGTYNAGFDNVSILDMAKLIKKEISCEILINKSVTDPRNYRLDSSKLLKIGFKPSKNIINAIKELKEYYINGTLSENPKSHSLKWLKKVLKNRKV